MLIINGYEKSVRTSNVQPYAHKEGETVFLPFDIKKDGDVYSFTEYRFNKGVELPQEVVNMLIDAFIEDEEALKAMQGDEWNE